MVGWVGIVGGNSRVREVVGLGSMLVCFVVVLFCLG